MSCLFFVASCLCDSTPGSAVSVSARNVEPASCSITVGEQVRWTTRMDGCCGDTWPHRGAWRLATGTVVESGKDSLVVAVRGASDRVVVHTLDVDRLEVRRPRAATQEGAMIGAVAGALLGGLVSFAADDPPCNSATLDCFEPMDTDMGLTEVLIGGLVGGAIGAAIGTRTRILSWQDVECRFGSAIRGVPGASVQFALSF